MKSKKFIQQIEQIYQLAHEIGLSIEDTDTSAECLTAVSHNYFKVNPDKSIQWLKDIENLIIKNNAKHISCQMDDIRDIYMENGFLKEAVRITKTFNLKAYKAELLSIEKNSYKSMPEKWYEITSKNKNEIDEEPLSTVRQLLSYAHQGHFMAAKNMFPLAIKSINEKIIDKEMRKYYLYYDFGLFLLYYDKIDEAKKNI